nr:uncharacterized protein C20orf96 homolog [Anolis sagrei ordinatus]
MLGIVVGKQNFPSSLVEMSRDYSPWQRKARKQTPRLDLPPLNRSEEKKEGRNKSVSERSPVFGLKMPLPVKQRVHFSQAMAKEMKLAKSLENIKILQRISKSRRHSLDELKHHSKVLLKKNLGLMEWIKEMDYESAKDARDLLQQYEMFGTVITTLRDSTQNQVGIAKRELMEKEKIVEKNMGKLDAEMGRMNTKVQSLQDELNVLRSYMDKEYPVKAVQISSLMRSIRNLIEEQQDELECFQNYSRKSLMNLSGRAFEQEEHVFQNIAEKQLMKYHEGLTQMNRNNLELKRQIAVQKELIAEMVKEVKELHRSIIKLHHSTGDPRNMIFADVLLRKPKCMPDMDVVLDIPTDEDFPL